MFKVDDKKCKKHFFKIASSMSIFKIWYANPGNPPIYCCVFLCQYSERWLTRNVEKNFMIRYFLIKVKIWGWHALPVYCDSFWKPLTAGSLCPGHGKPDRKSEPLLQFHECARCHGETEEEENINWIKCSDCTGASI